MPVHTITLLTRLTVLQQLKSGNGRLTQCEISKCQFLIEFFFSSHVGDLGNVVAGSDGVAKVNITDDKISLCGQYSILGRAMVVSVFHFYTLNTKSIAIPNCGFCLHMFSRFMLMLMILAWEVTN